MLGTVIFCNNSAFYLIILNNATAKCPGGLQGSFSALQLLPTTLVYILYSWLFQGT